MLQFGPNSSLGCISKTLHKRKERMSRHVTTRSIYQKREEKKESQKKSKKRKENFQSIQFFIGKNIKEKKRMKKTRKR